jgi:hypothetical protein
LGTIAVIAATLATTGCGETKTSTTAATSPTQTAKTASSPTQTSTSTSTRASYIAQADAVCQRFRPRLASLAQQEKQLRAAEEAQTPYRPSASPHRAEVARHLALEVRELANGLGVLTPPDEGANAVPAQIRSALLYLAATLDQSATALATHDFAGGLRAATTTLTEVGQVNGLAAGYGLHSCTILAPGT